MSRGFYLLAVLAGMLAMMPASATTLVLEPSADTWLNDSASDNNYGASSTLSLSSSDPILFAFDIASIPANSTIVSATLSFVGSSTGPNNNTISVYAISAGNDDWVEGDQNGTQAATGESTYDNRRYPSTAWIGSAGLGTSGTDHAASAAASQTLRITNGTRVSFDLTSLVQSWYANPGSNNGIVVKASRPASNSIYSRETANSANRPQLTINYTRPVGYWRFDETSWNGSTGEIRNEVASLFGTAKPGGSTPTTANASPIPPLTGDPGSCRYGKFDGADDYVSIPKDSSLQLLNEYTAMAWIYPTSLYNSGGNGSLRSIFSNDENFEFHVNGNRQIYWWWANSGGAARYVNSVSTISLNAWQHVAIRYTRGSQTLFINGVQQSVTCSGGGSTTSCSYNENIKVNANAELQIGHDFINGRQFAGGIDEVRLYDAALSNTEIVNAMNERHACVSTLSTFRISHDGTGINCQPEPVTIRAVDASGNTVNGFVGTVSLSTSTGHGTWSKAATGAAGTLSMGAADSGLASYSFVAADSGVATLLLSNTHPESLSINVLSGGAAEDPNYDPALVFQPTGLRFLAGTNTTLPTQIAGRNFQPTPLYLEAISTDPSNNACTALFDKTTQPVRLAAECEDPTTCGASLTRNGSALSMNNNGAISAYTTVNLDFSNGKAELGTLNFPDAGRLQLHASTTLTLGTKSVTVTGSSNAFVVRPFAFDIQVPGNPGASTASGARFKRAGEDFGATVRAVTWESADDANNDGLPDSGANLGNNALTPGFGRHATAPATSLNQVLVAPVGGSAGGLTGGGSLGPFNSPGNGQKALTLNWSEVGILGLSASLPDYLGSGQGVSGSLSPVGRFYPASFLLADPQLTPGCTGFTYAGLGGTGGKSGQIFGLRGTLSARSLSGGLTQNYVGSFARLGGGDLTYTDPGGQGNVVSAGTGLTVPGGSGAGYVDYLVTSPNYQFSTTHAPYSFKLNIAATDPDGVAGSVADTEATEFRYGRLRLDSVAGPADQALPVPVSAEYWTGSAFALNSLDSCTAIAGASTQLGNWRDNLEAGETAASGSATLAGGRSSSAVVLSAPGAGNEGSVDLMQNLGAQPWLRFDWGLDFDGDGTPDTEPQATAIFGLYRGSDRVIYWRER